MKKTVIISCAGSGSRLGMEIPKCLVQLEGKSLIEIQLEQLKEIEDIRIVVGYKKDLVIEKLKEINNSNVKIYENNDYRNTGTASSFCKALDGSEEELVVALDGDLIVNPNDMKNLLQDSDEFICGEKINTENPVLISLNEDNEVVSFSREKGEFEWAGLAQIRKNRIIKGDNHVYQILEPLLPLKFRLIHAKEIDTTKDLVEAKEWYVENFRNKEIIDNWFKSRFNIKNNYETSRHAINNRADYDIELIKRFINEESTILDLGCGTGILEELLASNVKFIKAIDKYEEFIKRAAMLKNVEYEKHDVETYYDKKTYDLIMMFGVSIYLLNEELEETIKNCIKMMKDNSVFIIKNQWSLSNDDYVIDKQYSATNLNKYYCIYRSLDSMKKILEKYQLEFDIVDIYPEEMNLYQDTHEYALICKKSK